MWNYECSDIYECSTGGSTDIYECSDDLTPDLDKRVGTYSFIAGPSATVNGNDLILVTEQFDINGCILQRIGNYDIAIEETNDSGIWTTSGPANKGCPKASNIDPAHGYAYEEDGPGFREMYTLSLIKPVPRTPLTPARGGK